MIRELRIKNLAIIDDLSIRFDNGLNVITGETGAGKSIIVDSLSLALGSKSQPDLIRSGEKEAIVQAYFESDTLPAFQDIGIDTSDGIILRRSIPALGRSRAYINDTIVSMQVLSDIGRSLVDIHGQHEHQSLLSVEKHRLLLDSFGRLHEARKDVASLYREVEILKMELNELKQKVRERAQRIDLLKFQIQEIDSAALKADEKELLLGERAVLSNLGRLKELAETGYLLIYGSEDSCIEKLSVIISKAEEMSSIDHTVSEMLNILRSAYPLIEESAAAFRSLKDKYELEPEKLAELEDRIDFIKKLETKYGESIQDILAYRNDAEEELKRLERADEKLGLLELELTEKEKMLYEGARSLSEKRKKTAKEIEGLMKKELNDLAFSNADFVIDIKEGEISASGIDRVEFLFSGNPGEPPKPLSKIASGGELSRVMLALKTILADFDSTPVLIFDEVDAGIGGKTAQSVGKKLKRLASSHQVLCTTHLPQIASLGDFHLKTEKKRQDGRIVVQVKELSGQERLREIARMLAGNATEVSLKHAQELLKDAV